MNSVSSDSHNNEHRRGKMHSDSIASKALGRSDSDSIASKANGRSGVVDLSIVFGGVL